LVFVIHGSIVGGKEFLTSRQYLEFGGYHGTISSDVTAIVVDRLPTSQKLLGIFS
jgi:hypothetical protein